MNHQTLPRALRRHRLPGVLCRVLAVVVLLPLLTVTAGCSGSGPKNTVSGKVTLKGQLILGSITFVGPNGKEVTAPINPDTSYLIPDPAMGENKIAIKGIPGAAPGGAPAEAGQPGLKKDMMKDMLSPTTMGVPPPAKYATPGGPDGKLTFTVTGGKQEFNIELKP
jgi:hypothetical protein